MKAAGNSKHVALSVLFSDIRGFTTLSQLIEPRRLRSLLHEYVEGMLAASKNNRGTVDKLMGDGLMALFGYPRKQTRHARNAVNAAQEMLLRVEQLRGDWQAAAPGADLAIRIGIASGPALIEETRLDGRREIQAIGDIVNLAARLEQRAEPGTILVSAGTHAETRDDFDFEVLQGLELKGYDDALLAYVPQGRRDRGTGGARAGRTGGASGEPDVLTEHRRSPRSSITLYVNCEVHGEQERHRCLDISERGAFIDTKKPHPVGTRLRIHASLPSNAGVVPVTLDGRVVRVSRTRNRPGMGVQFLSVKAESLDTISYVVREVFGLGTISRRQIHKKEDGFKYILETGPRAVTLRGKELPVSFAGYGIENSDSLSRRLAQEYRRTKRYGGDFTCVVVALYNLDKLPPVLATNSIEEIALAMAQSVRDTDELYYLNEMKFFVLAPETLANRAGTLAQRIAAGINSFLHSSVKDLQLVEVDIGIFTFDGRNARSPEDLVLKTLVAAGPGAVVQ